MKYMGSKARISKHILPIILSNREEGQYYVEPFLGGANSMMNVDGNRIGGEINPYISAMWKALISGWIPKTIDKELYNDIKRNKDRYLPEVVGWVGVACSYSGKWFGGFAGKVNTKGGVRDYQAEAFLNVEKQLPLLKGLKVENADYQQLEIPIGSIIYCDPPYKGTTKYKDDFDHDDFWRWCRFKAITQKHKIFISEYEAPDDFVCIWGKSVKSSLSANGKAGGNKVSMEKLFTHSSNVPSAI